MGRETLQWWVAANGGPAVRRGRLWRGDGLGLGLSTRPRLRTDQWQAALPGDLTPKGSPAADSGPGRQQDAWWL